METISKNKILCMIGYKISHKTSLTGVIRSFEKDLSLLHLSYQRALKKMASRHLKKLHRIESDLQKSTVEPSDLTVLKSVTRLISTFFNISQSLKSLDKKIILQMRKEANSTQRRQKHQLSLISKEEEKQIKELRILREDVTSNELRYKQAYDSTKQMIKEFKEQAERNMISKEFQDRKERIDLEKKSFIMKFEQHNDYIKLQESLYLQSLSKYNAEVEYYNNVKTKSNLCNFKIFFENLFTSTKDILDSYKNNSKDRLEIYNYLLNQIQDILISINPAKDAATLFASTCGDINYLNTLDEKLYDPLIYEHMEEHDAKMNKCLFTENSLKNNTINNNL